MAVRLKSFVNRVEKAETQTAAQRVADFMLKFSRPDRPEDKGVVVRLPYDKQPIANRLGMKPETLSRSLSALREQGVHVDGARAEIRDLPALKRFTAPG